LYDDNDDFHPEVLPLHNGEYDDDDCDTHNCPWPLASHALASSAFAPPQLFSGRHGALPTPVFIDADPQAFRFVLDFLRAVKNKGALPRVPEALASSVLVTAQSFGLTDLEEMMTRAAAPARGTHTLSYEMVVQFYLNGKINFSGMNLHGYSFRGWQLVNLRVGGEYSVNGHFEHANLRGCDFSYACLPSYNYFKGAGIEGCTFTGTAFYEKDEAYFRQKVAGR